MQTIENIVVKPNGTTHTRTIKIPDPEPVPEPEPTETEQLRADVDYIAIMTGVEL